MLQNLSHTNHCGLVGSSSRFIGHKWMTLNHFDHFKTMKLLIEHYVNFT